MEKAINTKPSLFNKETIRTVTALLLLFSGIVTFIAFVSFFFSWQNDQSQIGQFLDRKEVAENVLGKLGGLLGYTFVYNGMGITTLLIPLFLVFLGLRILTKKKIINLTKYLINSVFFLIWIPIFLAFILPESLIYCGVMGFEINDFLQSLIGYLGIIILLFVTFLLYLVIEFNLTMALFQQKINAVFQGNIFSDDEHEDLSPIASDFEQPWVHKPVYALEPDHSVVENNRIINENITADFIESEASGTISKQKTKTEPSFIVSPMINEEYDTIKHFDSAGVDHLMATNLEDSAQAFDEDKPNDVNDSIAFSVEKSEEEIIATDPSRESSLSERLVSQYGEYDPRLDLSSFKFPSLDILVEDNSTNSITVDQKELEGNKNRIVETLNNYGISIAQIKATIGPTVTLYEIIPEAGVRISKIKNLEDDIALSLSALGIRIIAPIPGKGTIGIEVPNSHPTMVSMRSVLASQKFQTTTMELPIAFGKTISNETFVADLAKMPHLLMAGATGQGKSVGLNTIITSLLYKKHPSELKFIFVDPKKVELTLYNKIERHYLAKLPDVDEAIITDNTKVINTLNSLCIEMDNRYELLKTAYVRNIKEYNDKFKARKLNPEEGHQFLPYIVLVIDEFADLIMTAGKEVELPVARLAQLARAIGIHLIIATQRPSVNVITGTIKANFPARVAFRVTSKIDSRTILDSAGADQLIGKGDMLFTTGNELIRLQCAFIDTPEVDLLTEFIGSQKGYPSAFLLPEYVGEGGEGTNVEMDPNDRDGLFEDAARMVIMAQQGSASLLQRKLKLGYNRAGRIIDQLEAAGIVGPFEGSKARQVLVQDETTLERILRANG